MKKLLILNKITKVSFFQAVLLLLIINSCKKDIITADNTLTINPLELTQVKTWFNKNENLSLITQSNNWLNKISANWDKAYTKTSATQKLYELAVKNPDRIFVATGTVDIKQIETFENRSLIRLLIFEDPLTKNLSSCFMVMVAGESYDLKKTPLTELHYLDYKKFTGTVDFYDLAGNLVNGWALIQGKVTHSKTPSNGNETRILGNGKLMNAPEPCGTRQQLHWRQLCNTVGPGEGMSGEPVTTCTWESYYTTETIYCESNGNGGYNPPGGGTPPTEPVPLDTVTTIQNDCIKSSVVNAFSSNLKSKMKALMQGTFLENHELILHISDSNFGDTTLNGYFDAFETYTRNGKKYFGGKIFLNSMNLAGASKEFTTAILYHEVLHAYLYKIGSGLTQNQHENIATNYRSMMSSALIELFPGLSEADAGGLAWEGLQFTGIWALKPENERNSIVLKNYKYRKGTLGNKCTALEE